MVGGDDNQGFVGVLQVEVVGNTDGIVEVDDFAHGCAAVVAVSGMVDVAPLDHHKEPVGRYPLQMLKACACEFRQGERSGNGVDG